MSQWEEDFPDDEVMMGSPKPVTSESEPKKEDKTDFSTPAVEADEGKIVSAAKSSLPRPDHAAPPTKVLRNPPAKRALVEKPGEEPKLIDEAIGNKIATSDDIINEQESRLEVELKQLLIDIRRIGEKGKPRVAFGELFDDDKVANYYEALVGTLKSAKKRKLVDFKGQMLLKGAHDNVIISIIGE